MNETALVLVLFFVLILATRNYVELRRHRPATEELRMLNSAARLYRTAYHRSLRLHPSTARTDASPAADASPSDSHEDNADAAR